MLCQTVITKYSYLCALGIKSVIWGIPYAKFSKRLPFCSSKKKTGTLLLSDEVLFTIKNSSTWKKIPKTHLVKKTRMIKKIRKIKTVGKIKMISAIKILRVKTREIAVMKPLIPKRLMTALIARKAIPKKVVQTVTRGVTKPTRGRIPTVENKLPYMIF